MPFVDVEVVGGAEVMIWRGAAACCASVYFLAGWRNVGVAEPPVPPPPLPYPFAAVAFGAARIAIGSVAGAVAGASGTVGWARTPPDHNPVGTALLLEET